MNAPEYGHGTHVGRVRKNNEDSYFADPDAGFWVVADGMGGHEAGEVASRIAVETVTAGLRQGLSTTEAIGRARQAVIDSARAGEGASGMGSTVVVFRLDGPVYEVAWVGDSRAYRWNGSLTQLTRDHTFVQELVDAGVINEQDARHHPHRNRLTRVLAAIAGNLGEVETVVGTLAPGDCMLLCSDGLTSELSEEQIADILAGEGDVQSKVDRLIEAALAAGGHDNVTVLLVSAPPETKPVDLHDATIPIASSFTRSPDPWLLLLAAGLVLGVIAWLYFAP